VAWFHAIVTAYATGFDCASATTATCLRCRKGAAELDIDRDTKRGHARSERYRGKSPVGKARCGIFPSEVSVTVTARGRTMVFSCRTFLIARDDTLWRLSSTKFDQMLRDPAGHCLPDFAGQRARMAGNPVRVVRNTFSILTFDAEGRIDPSRFEKQQFALAESVFAPVFAVFADESNQTVVNATSRFIAQGGQWVPPRALARV
jgi:hypothetical protein